MVATILPKIKIKIEIVTETITIRMILILITLVTQTTIITKAIEILIDRIMNLKLVNCLASMMTLEIIILIITITLIEIVMATE